MGPCY